MSDGTDAGHTLQDIDDVIDQTPNRVDELRFEDYLTNLMQLDPQQRKDERSILAREPNYVPAGTPNDVMGVDYGDISSINGIATADIENVNGV